MSSLRAYAGCGLVVLLAVVGCSSGPDDPPVTAATTSVTSTTSSEPTRSSPPTAAVDIPVEARAHTPAGAEAFVTFFVEQSNLAWTKPAEGLLPPLSDPDCIACSRLESAAADLVAKRQRYVSAPITQIRATAAQGGVAGRQLIHLTAIQKSVKVVDGEGAEVRTDPAMKIARTVLLTWGDEQWRVFDAQ